MKLNETKQIKFIYNLIWRCTNWKCNFRHNIYEESLFKKLKVPLKTIYLLMHFFTLR